MDPSIIPFFLDSGASMHISTTEADFFSLRPIPLNMLTLPNTCLHCNLGTIASVM
jgi:hypothetical protein